MLKKILNKIQKFESQKQIKVDKISEIKNEINDIDSKLKNYTHLRKNMKN